MDIMTHAKFYFNRLMLTLIFAIRAWRTTKKAGPDRVKAYVYQMLLRNVSIKQYVKSNLKTSIRISSPTPYKSWYILGRLN